MTQNHQVTRFWIRRPPIFISISLARHVPLFLVGFKKSLKPLLIPNHQALFLRIAHGGAIRVEMT